MSITSRGKKWEILNSLWILFTFTLAFFNWIGFFYIGYKTKCKKWIVSGLIYSIPFIMAMLSEGSTNTVAVLTLILSIVGIVHAFLIRTEYLIRLEARGEGKTLTKGEVKEIIIKHKLSKMNLEDDKVSQFNNKNLAKETSFNIEEDPKHEDIYIPIEKKQVTKESFKNELIDINTASENELANLPGIGLILAKKAVNHRENKGDFNSVDEFAEILVLKPHVLERIKPLITIKISNDEGGNKDDFNKGGRIIDF